MILYIFTAQDSSLDNGYADYHILAGSLMEAKQILKANTKRSINSFRVTQTKSRIESGLIFHNDESQWIKSTIQSTPSLADVEIGY